MEEISGFTTSEVSIVVFYYLSFEKNILTTNIKQTSFETILTVDNVN
jgi:hypothetical protein